MKNRKLTLRRESITDLGSDDLGRLAGGASTPTCYSCVQCITPGLIPAVGPVPTLECFSHHNTCPVDRLSDLICRIQ